MAVFLQPFTADFGPQDIFATPPLEHIETVATAHPSSRATLGLTKITPRELASRSARDFIDRLRERSAKSSHPPPSRAVTEPPLELRRDVKGKGKAVRAFEGVSDWIADRRRRRDVPLEPCPLHLDCRG